MLWTAITISIIGRVLHIHIFSYLSKKISNKRNLATRRGLTLIIIMLPILYFADFSKSDIFIDNWYYVVLLGIIGAVSLYYNFLAQSELPSGVYSVLLRARIPIVLLSGFLILGEILTIKEYLGIFLILISSLLIVVHIGSQKMHVKYSLSGLRHMFIRILTDAARVVGLGFFVKQGDRALSAYILEINIAITLLIISIWNNCITIPSSKDMRYIALAGLCVLAGTGGMALATKLSNASFVTGVLAVVPIGNAILGKIFYNEDLTTRQWIAVLISVIGIIIMSS